MPKSNTDSCIGISVARILSRIRFEIFSMNSSAGSSYTLPAASSPYQHLSAKRSHSSHSASVSTNDLRDLANTLQELNSHFKQNTKVLTEIKDYIAKVCDKQDSRPVDDNSGVHKLERVSSFLLKTFLY
ncbi:unnamed protein product [Adineta ricciae]|uniref:Uncharacterized protein n=1 Tax=Adineta ricciae TaxID=249248 RepID=A0A815K790_ADIRI|nr:unnamed protein product [Adineta ricciae]